MENQDLNQMPLNSIAPEVKASPHFLRFLIPALIIAVIGCGGILYMQWRLARVVPVGPTVVRDDISFQSPQFFRFDSDIEIEYYAPYKEIRAMLIKKGYSLLLPDNPSIGEFPEIGNCGSGSDAICNVDFEKDGIKNHLNIGMSTDQAFVTMVKKYPYPYRIVIGNE